MTTSDRRPGDDSMTDPTVTTSDRLLGIDSVTGPVLRMENHGPYFDNN
jgi:hypothetical protein